jgi:molybdopterin/thiamine biosynthesis adenylyltransferase
MQPAQAENAKTLASLLQIEDDEAAQVLGMTVVVRASSDAPAQAVLHHVRQLLARTVALSLGGASGAIAAEILIGDVAPVSGSVVIRVGVTNLEITISSEHAVEHDRRARVPGILLLIGACYAAGMGVRLGLGRPFPLSHSNTIRVPLGDLVRSDPGHIDRPIQIGKVYLAGAGAIGNGVLSGLAGLDVRGELHIVDPKSVTLGILGRCLWFDAEDVGRPKAERLAARAQSAVPGIKLVPRVARLQDLAERSAQAWLERLVVAVDSRRARRRLQDELPRDVFDASTTGIEEAVFHFNQMRDHCACLSCIYDADPAEDAHERHVAKMLGVDLAAIRLHYIDADAARQIVTRHPQLNSALLVGTAFDSLFKTLCATGELGIEEGRTVLAPFSFVSVLAGAYLALELALRAASGDVIGPFNYWRVSPWTSPVFELRTRLPARANCETCGSPPIRAIVGDLWGWIGKEAR